MSLTLLIELVSLAVVVCGIRELRKVSAAQREILSLMLRNQHHAEDDSERGNSDSIRLRRDLIGRDPKLRFSALNDWVNTNYLSFLRRASRGWSTPADLIAHIPACFQAFAEISSDDDLLNWHRRLSGKDCCPAL